MHQHAPGEHARSREDSSCCTGGGGEAARGGSGLCSPHPDANPPVGRSHLAASPSAACRRPGLFQSRRASDLATICHRGPPANGRAQSCGDVWCFFGCPTWSQCKSGEASQVHLFDARELSWRGSVICIFGGNTKRPNSTLFTNHTDGRRERSRRGATVCCGGWAPKMGLTTRTSNASDA